MPVSAHDVRSVVVGQRAPDRLLEVVHLGAHAGSYLSGDVVLLTTGQKELDCLDVSIEQTRRGASRIRRHASAGSEVQNLADQSDEVHDAGDDELDRAANIDTVDEKLHGLPVWEHRDGSRRNPYASTKQHEEYEERSDMKGDASERARGRPERPKEVDCAEGDVASCESYDWPVHDAPDWRGLEHA